MRNLKAYPVTSREIEDCLTNLSEELSTGDDLRCGDMRPLLLRMAAKIVRRSAFTQEALNEI